MHVKARLVVNEAMAAGLPVLVSERCGCATDLVNEGLNIRLPFCGSAATRTICDEENQRLRAQAKKRLNRKNSLSSSICTREIASSKDAPAPRLSTMLTWLPWTLREEAMPSTTTLPTPTVSSESMPCVSRPTPPSEPSLTKSFFSNAWHYISRDILEC